MDKIVYAHIRLDTHMVFYIGKGTNKRMRAKDCRSARWSRIVNKHGYRIQVLNDGLTDKQSLALEIFWIAVYGRDNLINATDGGEGCNGAVRSEAHKKMISERHKGKKLSEEHIEKIRRGKVSSRVVITDEWRKRMSEAQLNQPRIECPRCGKTGKGSAMVRYHFNNCKLKDNK